jgi:uncharacterized protein YgbK (DUF1537 family)
MHRPLTAVADDLSGAAEIAGLLVGVTDSNVLAGRASILLNSEGITDADVDVVVHDLDARDGTRDLFADLADIDFCKVDSLLRGQPGVIAKRLLAHGRLPILAPALPALGRTTVGGRILIDHRPVEQSPLLALEPHHHGIIRERLSPITTRSISLAAVRGPRRELALALAATGGVPIVDAEDDDDLDRIVDAARLDDRLILMGSGGLAAALGRRRRQEQSPVGLTAMARFAADHHRSTLVVVGTGSVESSAQLAALESTGIPVVRVAHTLLLDASAAYDHPTIAAARDALEFGPVAITLAQRDVATAHLSRRLAEGLGRLAASMAGSAHLVLTGGETARRTLEQLRVTSLDPVQILEHGSVLSRIADGRAVITRPGSFGRPDNLVRAVELLSRLDHGTIAVSTPSRKAPL